ncbi:MAG: type I DNA topoisomerase, partial [Bacillota bacterium]
VAVRLICEREEEIQNFTTREYWTLEALLQANGPATTFKALLDRHNRQKVELPGRDQVDLVMQALQGHEFVVQKVIRSRRRRRPPAPFTTSSLQQEASSKLGFTSRKTMSLAQQLYEGINIGQGQTVGLITYIRTDSTRISGQAQAEARELIRARFGAEYLPEKPPFYSARKGAQEAHEAIRPTDIQRDPAAVQAFLTRDQQRLYKLIWDRFTASQMAAALFDQVRARIAAGEYVFKAAGSSMRFPGFLLLYRADASEEDAVLPPLEEGQNLALIEFLPEQHFTQPPPRFNEASLVKTLEEKGIGRPSTYVPIIETIQSRGYVIKENKAFAPTELGFVVVELLKGYFPEIMDVGFTARMESQLDEIAEGTLERGSVLNDFYRSFKERLAKAEQEITRIELKAEASEETCPQCGKNLIFKHGRFGRFLACPGYPECKFTKNIVKETGVPCPLDGGVLVERRSKKGRLFYGCSNFPQCRFSVWDKPLPEKCPRCGSLMVEAGGRRKPGQVCSDKECGYKEPAAPKKAANES